MNAHNKAKRSTKSTWQASNKYWWRPGTFGETGSNSEASRWAEFTSQDKPSAEVDLPWSQPKEDFYQMCLNKSLLLFLTCVEGKIYFAPERKTLHFLLNSLVNQEEPETSAWQPLTLILFAKLKGCLSFGGACACAKQQGQCWTWARQCKGTLRRQGGSYWGPKVVAWPGAWHPQTLAWSWQGLDQLQS